MALTKEEVQEANRLLKLLETEAGRTYSIGELEETARRLESFGKSNAAAQYRLMAQSRREMEAFAEDLMLQMMTQVPPELIEKLCRENPKIHTGIPSTPSGRPSARPVRQDSAQPRKGSNWTFFFGSLAMVLFVVFTAAYEGARIGLLSDDPKAVAHVAESARSVEDLLMKENGSAGARLVSWRSRALAGDRSACRGLGLLSMTGRGSVAVPTDDIVMSRWWSLFGFSFYFGMGVFGYYVVRPLWKRCQKGPRRSCVGMTAVVLLLLATFYVPGLIVFHFARCWYPALSAWMVGAVSGVI